MHVFQTDIELHWRLELRASKASELRKGGIRHDSFQNNWLLLQLPSSSHLAKAKVRENGMNLV
jgi:hypothetical protein